VSSQARAIYALLYKNRHRPLTMLEIRKRLEKELGTQEQLDRRRRELSKYFVIERSGAGGSTAYRLTATKPMLESEDLGISEAVRARVLQFGRCGMCGRTAMSHGVVLQVDHKIPQSWGGSNEEDNLQALCEECNRGKKAYFATLDEFGPQIRAASQHDEPHKRIGEMLKLVAPGEVRSDVLEMVAHAKQYQEDWQKRLRELRELGWVIIPRRAKEDGRVRVYWRLEHFEPWPEGSVRVEIRKRQLLKKKPAP
jgi:5-methylcytosine-specific restriction endonuclease McrA